MTRRYGCATNTLMVARVAGRVWLLRFRFSALRLHGRVCELAHPEMRVFASGHCARGQLGTGDDQVGWVSPAVPDEVGTHHLVVLVFNNVTVPDV